MNKKITFLFTLFSITFQIGFSQQNSEPETGVIYPSYMGISKPLSDYFVSEEDELNATTVFKESKDREHRTPQTFQFTAEDGPEYRNDESTIQREQGNRSMLPPLTNWAGQTGGGSCPPDPSGAAGPNHYVQAVNATPFKVFNKTSGATMGSIREIGSLWNPDTGNDGDPIILYDKYADRWFVSQFGSAGSNYVYIAISTTNDPTGTYYTYSFTSPQFPDYLKFSIWADGYYMTANTGTDRVFVFERNKMLLGQTARSVFASFTTGNVSGFFAPLPADADGVLPPLGTPCPFFWYTENSWGGGNTDGIKYINATVNWVPTTPTLTFSSTTTIPTAAFDGTYSNSWNDISQGSGNQKLDGIGGVVWYRAQWRQWTGYNTVLLCWGVKISAAQRSIKWVELRQNQPTGAWTLYQEGIYAPDALNRWVGSIAMDDNGSIALAYAVAGPNPVATAAGLRYTGRLATDPLGQMTFTETVAFAGSGTMTPSCGNRFGDYSQTSLDPNGTTFWHTGEYVLSGNPATRIYSFELPLPTELKEAKNELNYNVYQNGNALLVNADNLSQSGQFVVDLFDIQGRKIDGQIVNANDNKIRTSFDVNNFAKGIYMVRIGKANTSFQKVIKVPIN
jgi:hypothetical protein